MCRCVQSSRTIRSPVLRKSYFVKSEIYEVAFSGRIAQGGFRVSNRIIPHKRNYKKAVECVKPNQELCEVNLSVSLKRVLLHY